jgi:hypothetical protein
VRVSANKALLAKLKQQRGFERVAFRPGFLESIFKFNSVCPTGDILAFQKYSGC